MNSSSIPNLNPNKLSEDRNRILQQLQLFRQNPTSLQKYLMQRIQRYRSYDGQQYLVSKRHRKKAIAVHQKVPSKTRIGELFGFLFGEKGQAPKMQKLQPVPKLDEIAFKLCQTIYPNMRESLLFKPNTSQVLRQLLDKDPSAQYPSTVSCLVSLGFDQPYEDLINLLIDDGVQTRANRKQLFNPNLKYVGIASINTQNQPELRCTVYVFTDNIIKIQRNVPAQQNSPFQMTQSSYQMPSQNVPMSQNGPTPSNNNSMQNLPQSQNNFPSQNLMPNNGPQNPLNPSMNQNNVQSNVSIQSNIENQVLNMGLNVNQNMQLNRQIQSHS